MAKKRSASSVRDRHRGKNGKHTSDADIDFSDIPELTKAQLAHARRVGRPKIDDPKQLIAIRISPKLLMQLRKLAKKQRRPYQTLMHDLLEQAVKKAA